jgi:hypothetical protein
MALLEDAFKGGGLRMAQNYQTIMSTAPASSNSNQSNAVASTAITYPYAYFPSLAR